MVFNTLRVVIQSLGFHNLDGEIDMLSSQQLHQVSRWGSPVGLPARPTIDVSQTLGKS